MDTTTANLHHANGAKDTVHGFDTCCSEQEMRDFGERMAQCTADALAECKPDTPQYYYAQGVKQELESRGFTLPATPPHVSETFELPCYGGSRGTMRFRTPRDIAEMVSWCDSHSHIWFLTVSGVDARECKVNGKVRTWKRDKTRVEVPIKYGLYEYSTFDARDINRVLIPVEGGN